MCLFLRKKILFGTSNLNKLKEAKNILETDGISIEHFPVDLIEIQDSSLKEIAMYSIGNLLNIKDPIFVEDTGLFIESLNGFPGPYASYVFKTLGNEGILKLLRGNKDRNAFFESCIAYRDDKEQVTIFKDRCYGKITEQIRGLQWGYDPIFSPNSELNLNQKTFSELGDEIKNKISHRSKVLIKLKEFIT